MAAFNEGRVRGAAPRVHGRQLQGHALVVVHLYHGPELHHRPGRGHKRGYHSPGLGVCGRVVAWNPNFIFREYLFTEC